MNPRIRGAIAALLSFSVLAAIAVSAQTGDKYSARLGMVPAANAAQQAMVAGKGAVTAMLAGTRLTINGSFEGLPAAATAAKVQQGIAKGALRTISARGSVGGIVSANSLTDDVTRPGTRRIGHQRCRDRGRIRRRDG